MLKEFLPAVIVGAYMVGRDYAKARVSWLTKYPWILDAGAFAVGHFIGKKVPALSDGLKFGAVACGVKDGVFALIRLITYKPEE